MRRAGAIIVALLMGCGSSETSSAPPGETFALLVSSEPVEIQAPTTILVQIIVVGGDGAPVSITATDLPPFATLSGSALTLSPTLADAGDYAVTLTATSGTKQDSATLRLHVTRLNTPPMWAPVPMIQDAARTINVSSGGTITGTPYLWAVVYDDEADDMTLDAEIVPVGRPFTGVPTHSFPASPTRQPYIASWSTHAEVFSPLDGLTAPGSYAYQLRVTDALGAVDPYGWVEFGTFSLVP